MKYKIFRNTLAIIVVAFASTSVSANSSTSSSGKLEENNESVDVVSANRSDSGNRSSTASPNGLITNNRSKNFNISRLQLRYTDDERFNFTQSIFYRFSNKIYFAQAYEHRQSFEEDPEFNFFVWNVGGPITKDGLFSGVVRGQYATDTHEVYSAGLQYNLTQHDALSSLKKKLGWTSFIQVFPTKSDEAMGDWDILLYYSFRLYDKLYLRGNTTFTKFYEGENYIRSFQDVIYPIKPYFDIYVRGDYQSRDDVQFGKLGTQYSLGFRYNFSF